MAGVVRWTMVTRYNGCGPTGVGVTAGCAITGAISAAANEMLRKGIIHLGLIRFQQSGDRNAQLYNNEHLCERYDFGFAYIFPQWPESAGSVTMIKVTRAESTASTTEDEDRKFKAL